MYHCLCKLILWLRTHRKEVQNAGHLVDIFDLRPFKIKLSILKMFFHLFETFLMGIRINYAHFIFIFKILLRLIEEEY